jgi:hypothetical protein
MRRRTLNIAPKGTRRHERAPLGRGLPQAHFQEFWKTLLN